ncbi:hypothetical protein OH76DRAFT_1486528 [Lentinus brumalis]|uniref:Uncharacterized protein n=1 Tax=Lentinus brumalis TaxID=2498619 RepID=A0A371CY81_9APHY|nr:hypothetical protein OH76DRAFT_1486528 [Polyporus brumalis]
MSNLPAELLEIIFLSYFYRAPSPLWYSMPIATRRPPTSPAAHETFACRRACLMLVSRRWYDVICRAQTLWQDIEVTPVTTTHTLEAAMSHSGLRPLHVSCIFSAVYRSTYALNPLPLSVAEQVEVVSQAFTTLLPSATRWDSLSVIAEDYQVIDACLLLIDRPARPQVLAQATIIFSGANPHPRSPSLASQTSFPPPALLPKDPSLRKHGMRSLTSLTLRRCAVAWDSLRDVFSAALEDLNIDTPRDPVAVEVLVSLLSKSPGLQHLRLGGYFIRLPDPVLGEDASLDMSVHLPSLRHAFLSEMSSQTIVVLMRIIEAPNLCQFSLDLRRYARNPVDVAGFQDVLPHLLHGTSFASASSLRHLHLRRLDLRPSLVYDGVNQLYAPFISLTHLTLDFRTLQIEYWMWLLECSADGALPRLAHLSIAGLSPLEVQELICIRADANLPRVNLHMLVFFTMYDSPLYLHWLQRHTLSFTVAREF